MDELRLDPKVDYGHQLNATVWLLISVSAVFLFTRLYLKNCQNRGLWWDDYFLLGSWILLATQAGLVSHVVGLGYGRQVIPVENFPFLPIPVNILSTLLIIANLWGKTSFALTLLRIPERWMRVCVWFILISLTGSLVVSAVMVWISCLDFSLRGRCVPVDVSIRYNIFSCVFSATVDVVLAFLPWKFLWALEMSVKEKAGVVVAMSMGVFAGAAAGIKSATLPAVNDGTDPSKPPLPASVPLLVWGNAEAAICIMAASIPILRALARGNCRGPVPRGYETYEYGSAGMTESRFGHSTFSRTAVISLALPIQSPPASYPRNTEKNNVDEALTSGSPEPSLRCKATHLQAGGNKDGDNDSFEMTDYGHSRPQSTQSVNAMARPQSPLDFIGRDPAPQTRSRD
ncbi:hypothetical protein QBC40DRAFT_185167 [Triangularia verruculosa]|uniref:Rhodopsin domain-containing protein n=1 Tax=Triangularia verruculosa TaxID=2587418 RepID=A0AAN6X7R6_9PEZI|nr:hypothetical protein QBC40DRAFT_185167 [Triangularia verruculosa]